MKQRSRIRSVLDDYDKHQFSLKINFTLLEEPFKRTKRWLQLRLMSAECCYGRKQSAKSKSRVGNRRRASFFLKPMTFGDL